MSIVGLFEREVKRVVFAEWPEIRLYLCALFLFVVAVFLIQKACAKKKAQVLWILGALPVGVTALLSAGWGLAVRHSNVALEPVFSPSGAYAARVSIGPFGEEAVEVFRANGLIKATVPYGDLPTDGLRWISDRELQITASERNAECGNAGPVVVICKAEIAGPRLPAKP